MAGDEHRVVAHGPQAFADAGDELRVVAARKVSAADAAGEQHVAHEGALRLGRMKHHVARRVTGAVAHGQHAIAHLHRVAILQPARGREAGHLRKAEHAALFGDAVDPELVARVRADDGQAQPRAQLGRATGVVDVGVGEPDLLQVDAQLLHRRLDARQVATGVDDGGLLRGIAPDDGAVLRERGDGDGVVAEGSGHEVENGS